MRARAGRIRSAVLFAALFLVPSAHAQDAPAYRPGEVLVKFRPGASVARVRNLSTAIGGDVLHSFPELGIQRMRVTSGTVEQAVALLRADPAVVFAEPNYILKASGVPNDPMFPQLWGMSNSGQTGGTPGADIHAPQAWTTFTGSSSVLVGVIDTGIDYTHPDLAANIWTNPGEIAGNGLDDDANGYIDDVHGWDFANNDNDPMDDHYHGTHCAGTIGAVGDNGIGVAGVSWSVRMAAIKFLDAYGYGSTDAAIASIDYAARIGVRVINASWGGGGYSEALRLSIAAAGEAGVLFVAAAGNNGVNTDFSPNYPSSYDLDCIVAVAATDHNDQLAYFSNYGVATVDLAAPGVNVLSAQPGNAYQHLSGTSMATPHVVGVAALIRGRFPGASVLATKQLLLVRAQPLAALAGVVLTGARLDALASISDPDSIPPGPVADLVADQPNGDRIRLRWTAPGDDGMTGTAFDYDVRYAAAPIDSGNFDEATPATLEPVPGAPGTPQQMIVQGLDFATTYHFALRVRDEFGNASPVSNGASATTLPPPDIAVAPDSLSADLLTGATAARIVSITNSGPSDLVFTIERETLEGAGAIDVLTAHAGVPDRVIATGVEVPLSTLAGIPRLRTVAAGEYGAPDRAGVMKPLASGPGRQVFARNEEVFGNQSNAYYAGPRVRGNIFQCTTARRLREHRFYLQVDTATPLWFLVYEGSAPTGTFALVSATNVSPAGPGTGWYSSGPLDLVLVEGRYYMIVASYQQPCGYFNQLGISPYPIPTSFGALLAGVGWFWAPAPEYPPASGVDVPDDVYGDAVAYYQTIVTDDALTWVTAAPESGVVASGGHLDLAVTFDATGLNDGDYEGRLLIHSNDPDEPVVPVATHLHVTGAADIALEPDSLDYGAPFVGAVLVDSVDVRNVGTAALTVTGMTPAPAAYTVEFSGAFTLAPGERRKVAVRFAPTAPGEYPGTLTVDSSDPDQPVTIATLLGTALVAPILGVAPSALSADLLTGQQAMRTLTVTNTGGSNLEFRVAIEGVQAANVRIVRTPEEPAQSGTTPSHRAPAGYRAIEPLRVSSLGARVLLVQDVLPWGLNSVQAVLAENEIAYDAINSAQLAATDLDHYDVLIVPSDQFYQTYLNLAANGPKIDAFVTQGGRFEYHAAGYGFNGGEPALYTLPGGVTVQLDIAEINVVLLPGHPIAAGVPSQFTGNAASHVRFLNIPANAQLILGNGSGLPNLVQYPRGAGLVVAAGQTLEWGYAYGQGAGIVLRNLIPYVVGGAASWLSAEPDQGVVPPGGSVEVAVTFDATDLDGGDYDAVVRLVSNDPLAVETSVPAHLRVTGAPNIAVLGQQREIASTATFTGNAGSTHHVLALPSEPGGGGRMRLTLEGDFDNPGESARLIVDGVTIGTGGERNIACTPDSFTFDLTDAQLAQFSSDGLLDVTVLNTLYVDPFCQNNRHGVRLFYRDPADRVAMGLGFVGGCVSETLEVANTGTDSLRLEPPVLSHGWYTAVLGTAVIPPRSFSSIVVTFCPLAAEAANGTLTLASNDADQPTIVLALEGTGVIPPDIVVAPLRIEVDLDTGAKTTRAITISNTGGPLLWSASLNPVAPAPPESVIVEITPAMSGALPGPKGLHDPPALTAAAPAASPVPVPSPPESGLELETVLARLDAYHGTVTSLIPNRYDFTEGFTGSYIADGGNDMYNFGNYLWTDFGGTLPYSDGQIVNGLNGAPGRYFTRKYQGLFVLVADLQATSQISIGGSLGADGVGSVDGAVIDIVQDGRFRLFIKRVYNAGDPSVNHLIIVPDGENANHGYDYYTGSDYHYVYGLTGTHRIYDLLYAGRNGAYIDNAQAIAIARAFLLAIGAGGSRVAIAPRSGGVPGGGSGELAVSFDATGLGGGIYPGLIEIESNDPDEGSVIVETFMHVRGVADIAVAPDTLRFGARFVDVTTTDSVRVRNEGTDLLRVTGLAASPSQFTVAPDTFALAPGSQRAVAVSFKPTAPGAFAGTLTITSDDSDEPNLGVGLLGSGILPPTLALSPDSLSATLPPGGQQTKVLAVSNTGGAELSFAISLASQASAAAARILPVPTEPAPSSSDRAPEGYRPENPPHAAAAGAHVLLVQDALPFGAPSNQAVLSLNGIAYDQKTTSQLAATNLASYVAVIVASDQPMSAYYNLAARAAQLDAYVQQGGRLEFHAAGFGYNGGDPSVVTLPGGMFIEYDTASTNHVLLPGHPIVAGVPEPFTGNLASHVRFTSIPAGAQLIVGDASHRPNLVSYHRGAGLVVASGQALENAYQWGEPAGRILENMILYVANVPSWLRTAPNAGFVQPGQQLQVQVTFDAAGLVAGLYGGQLEVSSNDPARPLATVPAKLNVFGASSVTGTEDDAPLVFGLAPIAPTPSLGSARIHFTLSRPGPARAAIYDVAGRLVRTLADGPHEAGRHALRWEGQDERGVRRGAGIYLLRLESAEGRLTRRLVWIP